MFEQSFGVEALWILIGASLMLLIQGGLRALGSGPSGVRRRHAAETVSDAVLQREITTAALNDAEAKYRSIFENAIEGIFQTTPDGTYVAANPALARIYGYANPEELIRGIGDIERQLYVDPQRRGEFQARIQRDGLITDFESQVFRRDGSMVWIAESARAVVSGGQVQRYEGTVIDITERKQLDDWRRQKVAADAANHAKSSFLTRVSHEIRTPLNGVIGMLEVLAGSSLTPKQQHQLRVARTSATSLLGLINDLLDFSKIEAGKLELETVPFSLRTIAADIEEAFGHVAASKQLALSCDVSESVPEFVLGDPDRVRQILVNLVNNALKFTENGHVAINIEAHPQSPMICFHVRDTGIGIPESRQGRLFHDFMQVDSSTSRKYGGTGLGLAICRQLVELMDGEIGFESQAAEGSTFRVRLPLAATSLVPTLSDSSQTISVRDALRVTRFVEAADEEPAITFTQGRLLLAEDNEINQMVAVELLKMADWSVDVVANGLEAVAAVQRTAYDGILMDCQMPEMDGLTAAREIRLLEAAGRLPRCTHELIPIIAFTANAASEDRERCLAAGMNAFAVKPLVIEQLLATIQQVVGGRRPSTNGLSAAIMHCP